MGSNLKVTEYGSAATSVNKDKVPQLFTWAVAAGLIKAGSSVFDCGCGRWIAPVRNLLVADVGVARLDQWDPNWYPDADYVPFCGYDVVCLSNVLNVIREKEDRITALKAAWDALKPGGVMLVTVYEADGSGASGPSKDGCWQERRKLSSYVEKELCAYCGHVVPGTRLWVSFPKPEDGAKYYPPEGTKVTLTRPSGSAVPYTVVGHANGKLRIRKARLVFDGPRYYDTVADRIEEGLPGDPEEELVWKAKAKRWGGKGKYGAYPVFGKWIHSPNLD
jgi:SAM-dependent methyltransferase